MNLPFILADGALMPTPTQWALLIAGVALVYSIRRWRIKVLRKNANARISRSDLPSQKSAPLDRPTIASSLSVREVTSEIQSLLADLEETARRLAAQMDNRRARLDQLLAEADEKIKRLESL